MSEPWGQKGLDRRTVMRFGLAAASALVLGTGNRAEAAAGAINANGSTSFSNGTLRGANASVERVHVPRNSPELHAHLFLNAAIHGLAGLAGIGVVVTLIYRSGGRMVSLQSASTNVGALDAKGVDSETVRVVVRVPYGTQAPDPGTAFVGRAQVFARLPGKPDVPFGPAE